MEKSMRKRIALIIAVVVLAAACVAGYYFSSKPAQIKLRDPAEISKVQVNVFSNPADRWGESKVKAMKTIIEDAEPLSRWASRGLARTNEQSYIFAFTYTDDVRVPFYFFQQGNQWYMQSEDGSIYKNIDAFADTVSLDGVESVEVYSWPNDYKGTQMGTYAPDEERVKAFMAQDRDFNSYFTQWVQYNIEAGYTEEEAVEGAKNRLRIYNYAVKNGYEISDADYKKIVEERITLAKEQTEYPTVEAAYEAAGTTLEDYQTKYSEVYGRIEDTVEYMNYRLGEKFRVEGEDTVDGTTYSSIDDYVNAYIWYVIVPEITDHQDAEFEKQIDEAVTAWQAYSENSI